MNIIETFLESGYYRPTTKNVYKSTLKEYFKVINKKPETYFEQKQEEYKQDVMNYFRYLQNHNSHAIKNKIYCIKSFLIYNEIELKTILWIKIIKSQPTRPIAIDRKPTKQILKDILTHAQAKEKAIILLAITSGMRINEILNLKTTDINLTDKEPYTINVSPETKTKNRRIAFTNEETKQAINQWLKIRPTYIKSKKNRGTHLKGHTIKSTKTDKIFPFTYETTRTIWENLLIKSGHAQQDTNTNRKRYIYRIHTLRKYFKSKISQIPEISETIAETLLGHEIYMKHAYNRYEPEELRDFYKKAIPELNLFETREDLTTIKEEIQKLKEENTYLKESIKLHDFVLKQITDHPKEIEPKDAVKHLTKYNKNLTKKK